jgi:serine/threonine protein kinase
VLKNLEGQTHVLDDELFMFVKSSNFLPAARQGGEGYAVPLVGKRSGRCILKSYHLPTPQRTRRIIFLSALHLAELLPAFEGVPTSPVMTTIKLEGRGESFDIHGYLAPFVTGETFEELLQSGWTPTAESRLRIAAQLCHAVRVLEAGHLAHGDLSMANIMISDFDQPRPSLRLIDFDGFHHPHQDVPEIPWSEGVGGRGLGTLGYRHPIFAQPSDSAHVTSDRYALAILVCEILWLTKAEPMFDQEELDTGIQLIPAELEDAWPQGMDLLRRALDSATPELAPSPSEWCAALGAIAARDSPFRRTLAGAEAVAASIPLRILEAGQIERRVNLRGVANSFASVSPRLSWLSYARAGGVVILHGTTSWPLVHARGGSQSQHKGQLSVLVAPGDRVEWRDFVIEVG